MSARERYKGVSNGKLRARWANATWEEGEGQDIEGKIIAEAAVSRDAEEVDAKGHLVGRAPLAVGEDEAMDGQVRDVFGEPNARERVVDGRVERPVGVGVRPCVTAARAHKCPAW